jgi:uncharacterized membrane protein YukC
MKLGKEEKDKKRNYIFQKDKLTKYGFYFVGAGLIILIIATILIYSIFI